MSRLITEPLDAQDFLIFQSQGNTVVITSPTLDYGGAFNTSNNSNNSVLVLSGAPAEIFKGVYFYLPGTGPGTQDLILFRSGATILGSLRYDAGSSKLVLRVNGADVQTGLHVIQFNTLYHVQVRYKVNASGVFEIKLDEDLDVVTYSGNTVVSGATSINRFDFCTTNSGTFFDSLYINDTSGSEDNGYGGIIPMLSRVPTSDGFYTAWSKSVGTQGFANVDETPHDGDGTYNYSSTNGQKISYNPAAHGLVAPATIRAISARHIVKKITAGQVKPFFRVGGVDYPMAAAQSVGVGYGVVMDRRTKDPSTGVAWTLGATPEVGLETII